MIEDPITLYVLQYAEQFGLRQELERILNLKENKEQELLRFIYILFTRLEYSTSKLKQVKEDQKVLHWPHS
jgi:hypothetical protein